MIAGYLTYNCWRLLAWFRDDVFRRLFLNAGKLLSANSIAAILGLAATALTARALGAENYGVLALLLAYEQTIRILVIFNAWQAIIKYGSEALHNGDRAGMGKLFKFGFILDIGSAVVGTILAITLSGLVINLLGWDQSIRPLLIIFSILILFRLSGTPIGILRLFDRFDLLSYSTMITALVRLVGVIYCFFTKQNLILFVLVYLITGIIGQLYLIFTSLYVLKQNNIGNFFLEPLRGLLKKFPEILNYVWTTNIASTIRMLSRESDGLIIAALTTPSALGLYKMAKQFSRLLPMLIDPLYQSIFPELSRLWVADNKKKIRSLIKRSTLFVGIIAFCGWLTFIILGNWIITKVVGLEFQDSYWIAVWYMLALVIAMITFSFQPTMLALGLPKTSLKILVISTLIYFIFLILLVKSLGIIGASLSYIVFYLIWSILMFKYLRRYL